MAKSRAQKAATMSGITDMFRSMKSAVFTSISGYTMTDADALRAKGRESGVSLTLAKKTLLVRALKDAGIEVSKDALDGSILSAVGTEDEVAAAKLIADFAKGRDAIKIVGGFVEGKFIDGPAVVSLAKLVSKHHQLGHVVGTLNAPISSFVRILEAVRVSKEPAAV